jgi:prepilin-type N-terminal cleavage/methylation domain-containing protein
MRMWSAGSSARAARQRGLGFSLLELLVVLLIVSVSITALAAALPALRSVPAVELAASRLGAAMKTARARAIAEERVVMLSIDGDSRQLRAGSGAPVFLPRTVVIEPRGRTLIRFFPDGSADPAAFRLTEGQRQVRIRLSPLTGRVANR